MRKIHNLEWWPRVIVVRLAMAAKTIARMATVMMTSMAKVVKVVGLAMAAKTIAAKVVGSAAAVMTITAKIRRSATVAKMIAIHKMSSNIVYSYSIQFKNLRTFPSIWIPLMAVNLSVILPKTRLHQ